MLNIIVWGAGAKSKVVIDAIKKDRCNLIGIVDSNPKYHGKTYHGKWRIDIPEKLIDESVDYVVISAQYSSSEIIQRCKELGMRDDKIIDYWKSNSIYDFIDSNIKKIYEMEIELTKYKYRLENLPYELGVKPTPIINSAEKLLEIIIKEKKSLSRFGDGELEIMQHRDRPWFQKMDNKLSERLQTIFQCKNEQIIIALSDDFGSLEQYKEQMADGIREYLGNGRRNELMKVVDLNRVYYDAYVTRPYIIYKDKRHAQRIFKLFKQVWKNRDILLVEGNWAYIGIRNDLFEGANNIRRIIAPSENAYSKYDRILSMVKEHTIKDTLVLVSLGPTATVLAYDLTIEGIQALDIGQLDNEYEWYLREANERIRIPGKCVAEVPQGHEVTIIQDAEYGKQIVARI